MKIVSGKQFCRALERQGWGLDRVRGSHHTYLKGKESITIPVHGPKDLDSGLQRRLMKQAGLIDTDL